MIILITGATHTGKTALAQQILEKYNYPYYSIDHIKMGLIRSGNTNLTPEDDEKLTDYLWPIVREIIKTAVGNKQNLVIEGGYIPFDWKKDFSDNYLKEIRFYCLAMTKNYIENHFEEIKKYANVVENRIDDSDCTAERLICENKFYINMCKEYCLDCIISDESYNNKIELKNET